MIISSYLIHIIGLELIVDLKFQFETNSAVFSRLKLLRHLHQLLLSFSRREGTNLDDCPRHINGASDAAQQIAKQIDSATQQILMTSQMLRNYIKCQEYANKVEVL